MCFEKMWKYVLPGKGRKRIVLPETMATLFSFEQIFLNHRHSFIFLVSRVLKLIFQT